MQGVQKQVKVNKVKLFQAIKRGETDIRFTYNPQDFSFSHKDFSFSWDGIAYRCFDWEDCFKCTEFIFNIDIEKVSVGFGELEKELEKIDAIERR